MKAKAPLSPVRDTLHRLVWLAFALCAFLNAHRAEAYSYYVNNTSTNGDVFCTAPGFDGNQGLSPGKPMATLAALLSRYTLGPSDTVYVDAGTYVSASDIVVAARHGGNEEQPVIIQGAGRNTILVRQTGNETNACCVLIEASHVTLSGFVFTGARVGVCVNANISTRACITDNLFKINSKAGLEVVSSNTNSWRSFFIARNLFYNTGDCMRLESGRTDNEGSTFEVYNNTASTTNGCVLAMGGRIKYSYVRNNIFVANGGTCLAATYTGDSLFSSSYNDLWTTNGGSIARITINGTVVDAFKLQDWERFIALLRSGYYEYGTDMFNFSRDPAFASPATGDYHLKSFGGRWITGSGTNAQWTVDQNVHSPCIDAGYPYDSERLAFEPGPNGGRMNLGCYGGTAEASMSAPGRMLLAMAPDQGQGLGESQYIYWNATGCGWDAGDTLSIQYSTNGGAAWQSVTNAGQLSFSYDTFYWDRPTDSYGPSGCWIRVSATTNASIVSTTYLAPFPDRAVYYVNDASTDGDVFCTAAGLDTNDGLTPDTPMATLSALLSRYTLGYTNQVCVDAGTYTLASNIVVESRHWGLKRQPAMITGAGGNRTILMRQASGETNSCCMLSEASGLNISGFVFTGARVGLCVNAGVSRCASITDNVFKGNAKAGLDVFSSGTSSDGDFLIQRNLFADTGDCMRLEADITQATADMFDVCNNTAIATNGCCVLTFCGSSSSSSVHNNIFVANGGTCYATTVGNYSPFWSECNDLWATNGGVIARITINGGTLTLAKLSDWQRFTFSQYYNSARDARSFSRDPAFASPANGDYHLKSAVGRWSPGSGISGGQWVADQEHSPCIDAGEPYYYSERLAFEPAPNGGRLNLGCYGGTAEASMSATNDLNRALLAMVPDCGRILEQGQVIYWNATGLGWGSSDTVEIEYSTDGGVIWHLISTVAANQGYYYWSQPPVAYGSTNGCWIRMSATQDASVADKAFLPPPSLFFVNDSTANGDVWCTDVGNDVNDGLSSRTPLASVQAVIDRYAPTRGSTIYVDAGTYPLSADLVLPDTGPGGETPARWLSLIGAGRSTVFDRQSTAASTCCIRVKQDFAHIEGITCRNAETGILIDPSTCRNANIRGATFSACKGYGVSVLNDENNSGTNTYSISNSLFFGNGGGMNLQAGPGYRCAKFTVQNNTVVGDFGVGIAVGGQPFGTVLRNNIVTAKGSGYCLVLVTDSALSASNFNDLYAYGGASVARWLSGSLWRTATSLTDWQRASSRDSFSIGYDPFFVSATSGDFHLRSSGGTRYGTGWATYTVTSPCIDAGDPAADFAGEPAPNGNRINIGAYGGTSEASKSPSTRALSFRMPSQNDALLFPLTIAWSASGSGWSNNDTVRLEYLNGTVWTPISNATANAGALQTTGEFTWEKPALPGTIANVYLRVSLNSTNTAVSATVKLAGTIKRTVVTYYVNDNTTSGDVFCAAVGNDANTGTSSNAPMASLSKVLSTYTLGAGDTVYVDSGTYLNTLYMGIDPKHVGSADAPIRIIGVHGRTVLSRYGYSGNTLEVRTDHVRIENLTCASAQVGILVNASLARHVQLVGNICSNNALAGIKIDPLSGTAAGEEYQLLQNVVCNNLGDGIYLQGSIAPLECNTVFLVENNTILNSGTGITLRNTNTRGTKTNFLKNNLIHVSAMQKSCINALQGSLHYSDFNDLYATSANSHIGTLLSTTLTPNVTNHYDTLTLWRTATGQEDNSLSTNGLVVNSSMGNLRLRPNSPCVDAGINSYWMFDGKDPDGNARISGKACDIGAYELNVVFSVRLFLQGPYVLGTDHMANALSQTQKIPLQSPYADDPRTVSAIPGGATDWVLMQFRQTTNGPAVLSRSVFLRQDGWLLSDKGSTDLDLDLPRNQSFYLSVKHRNHLAALSAVPLSITNQTLIYDFTSSDSAYLGGSNACVTVSSGPALFRALPAGDSDGDGFIYPIDSAIAESQTNGVGYHRGDANLDGAVTAADLELISNNLNASSVIIRPDTPLTSILRVSPALQTLTTEEMSILEAVDPSQETESAILDMGGGSSALPFKWDFVRNASGAQPLEFGDGEPEALYEAGIEPGVTDLVEAWNTNDALGRATINVIASEAAAGAGKALIIAGRKSADDTLWPATDYLANSAYSTLSYRGFTGDNIVYLSPGTDEDIDYSSTFSNAETAFTFDVAGTDNLFVYLVDHGGNSSGNGYFRLNASETITAAQLDAWLDDLQNTHNTPVTVLLDFCYAGSFLQAMTYNGTAPRIVVASCGTNQPSYFVAGGLVSFSSAFFSGILLGYDVNQCFALAQSAMSSYQGALLDDNDTAAEGTYIGPTSVASGDVPTIGESCGNQVLTSETAATLWIGSVSSLHPISQAWCQIVPPGYAPDPDDPVTSLPSLTLDYDDASGRYAVTYDGFTTPGTYSVQLYVQDSEGNVSSPRQAFVSQTGFDDRAILVAGGDTNGAAWPSVEYLTELAYATLRLRLLPASHIRVLSPKAFHDLDGDGFSDVSALSTAANLQQAVGQWATTNATDRLTLYLIGGDSALNAFRINASESVATNALAAWVHAFQLTNPVPVTVILDFPYAGSFVPALADPDLAASTPDATRIVMASTAADGAALFSNGGTVSFSQYLLSEVIAGETLGDAFTAARRAIRRVSGSVRQRAQLDDTLDGVPNEKDFDGDLAAETFVGSAFVTGADNPVIGSVTPPTVLSSPGQPVTLWASDVAGMYAISNVWCTITPPGYAGEGNLPITNLVWQAANNRYEATSSDFVLPGSYTLTLYAQDSVGAVSDPVQSEIILADAYESDDDISQASFYDGRPQIHTFHTESDSDWVQLYLVKDFIYDFETFHHSETLDTVLDLYRLQPDGSLELLDHVDEEGSDLGEYTGLDYPSNGYYWARITPYESSTNDSVGTYEFSASIPAAAGTTTLIVLGFDDAAGGALPSNSVASITGQTNKYFSGSTSVVFGGLTNGTYLVSVPTPTNFFPREDPDLPNQVQSLTNSYYANPRRISTSGGWFLTGFELLPNVCVTSGLVRDAWTHAFIPGAQISFTASSGSLTGQVAAGGVILTSYCTNWLSAADGQMPSNIVLAACNWNLAVTRAGYQPGQQAGAVSNVVAGTKLALGTTYLVPLDSNANLVADSWEAFYFPGGMTAAQDSDGDGIDNYSEYLCGTDPTNALSVLRFIDGSVGAGAANMSWSVNGGRSYQIMSATSLVNLATILTNGPWEAAHGQTTMTWSDTEVPLHQARFYRVRLNTP